MTTRKLAHTRGWMEVQYHSKKTETHEENLTSNKQRVTGKRIAYFVKEPSIPEGRSEQKVSEALPMLFWVHLAEGNTYNYLISYLVASIRFSFHSCKIN